MRGFFLCKHPWTARQILSVKTRLKMGGLQSLRGRRTIDGNKQNRLLCREFLFAWSAPVAGLGDRISRCFLPTHCVCRSPIKFSIAGHLRFVCIEYFRSELYYLRFSWINAGYSLADLPALSILIAPGMYGTGFVLMTMVAICCGRKHRQSLITVGTLLVVLAVTVNWPADPLRVKSTTSRPFIVAGIQAEFPVPTHVPWLLDKALAAFPEAELFVLSEYTFDGPVPGGVLEWCRKHEKYLIAGGKEPAGDNF